MPVFKFSLQHRGICTKWRGKLSGRVKCPKGICTMGEVWGEMSHTRFAVRRSTCYSYSRSSTCAVHGEAGALADGQSLDEVS